MTIVLYPCGRRFWQNMYFLGNEKKSIYFHLIFWLQFFDSKDVHFLKYPIYVGGNRGKEFPIIVRSVKEEGEGEYYTYALCKK